MATRRIVRGQTETAQVTLAEGDLLIVQATAAATRTGAAPAVRIANGVGSASILNSGTISVAGANGAVIQGALGTAIDVGIQNLAGGVIRGQQRAIELTSAAGSTGSVALVNSGIIDGGNAICVDFDSLRATSITVLNKAGGIITNAGANDVLRPGVDLSAATSIRVDNAGEIRAGVVEGATSGGDAVDLQATANGLASVTVVNRATGLIEGGKHAVTGGNGATILNEGQLIGRNGSGINFDTELAENDAAVVVRNAGLISGRYDGFGDGDGDGVDVDYVVDVTNFGRIEGVGADNVENFADGIAAGGGRILNTVTAEIYGEYNGILIDDGDRNGAYAATTINNAGRIEGQLGYGVRLIGDFADTITNTGTIVVGGGAPAAVDMGGGADVLRNNGSIFGDVLLGAGDDVYVGAGFVDGSVFGGAGADRLTGGAGPDRLVGGLGADVLTGGDGADVFVFESVADSAVGASDRITDLTQDDLIDLSAIDANTQVDGDQAFDLVGNFTGRGSEIRIVEDVVVTRVLGDIDGDKVADFVIVLTNGATLLGDNFVL
jgi:hypothetical protein